MRFGLHQSRRHGGVVEEAIAGTAIGVSVVGAAGELHRHAVMQRGARGADRCTHRAARSFGHLGRPRQADGTLRLPRQQAVTSVVHIGRCMRERQLTVAGSRRFDQLHLRARLQHALAQEGVFGDWKTMTRRQRYAEPIGAVGAHQKIVALYFR
jgi:hypothetical protein